MSKSILDITDDLGFAYLKGNIFELNLDAQNEKVIVFSDLHRGDGGGNDDFRHCEKAYKKALQYYLDNNYRLVLLGDVEELWENFKFSHIYGHYSSVYALEKQFFIKGTEANPYYIRCFGNHDYRYAFQEFVNEDLDSIAQLPGIKVYEGVKLNLRLSDETNMQIYLSHGHQGHYPRNKGTAASLAVALFGAVQNLTHVPTNQSITKEPPLLKKMRLLTNTGYLKWAHRMKLPVIYGHTHEAIFNSTRIFNGKPIEVNENDGTPITTHNAFNTGCCSFINGEITGIEIVSGKLRLVKWNQQPDQNEAIVVKNKHNETSEVDLITLASNL